jgi:cytoskeletal protein CcmA (bactofilin family)
MNVLARMNNGSNPPTTEPVKDASYATARPLPQALGTPRAYAGPSIISAALTVIGRLECAGDIQIDGKVEGDIRGQAVRIGSAATVKGTVHGELVELSGKLEGKIEARSAILGKTAHMAGDIVHQSLQIEEGAYFNGNSRPQNGK